MLGSHRDDITDCLDDLIGGDAHEFLAEDVFYKFLRQCCQSWTQAIVDLLNATAVCLPESIIQKFSEIVQDLAENYWQHDGEGLKDRDLQRLCGPESLVSEVLRLHALTSQFLVQVIVTNAVQINAMETEPSGGDSPQNADLRQRNHMNELFEQSQLALSVLARRDDYLRNVKDAVTCDGVTLDMFLPPPSQIRIRSTPAAMIAPSAKYAGYLMKEGERKASGWKKRYFVLWRHPTREEGDFYLLWYENEDSTRPKSAFRLEIGTVRISHPKNKRKDYPNAFRVDVRASGAILNDDDDDK